MFYFASTSEFKLNELNYVAKNYTCNGEPIQFQLLPGYDGKEIQSLDSDEIITDKFNSINLEGPVFKSMDWVLVEDTSFEIDYLNGLPGPFIKYFLQTIGADKLARLRENYKYHRSEGRWVSKICLGLTKGFISNATEECKGIVFPFKDKNGIRCKGYGFDSIFKPLCYTKTFAEMSMDERLEWSPRMKNFANMCEFIQEYKAGDS